jgi:CBS domain-containing protein
MQVAEVMSRKFSCVDADTSIQKAALQMKAAETGLLPVVEGGRLAGVVTDYDIVAQAVAGQADLTTTTVRDVVSKHPLVVCRPDTPLEQVFALFLENRVWRVVVVDASDRPVGILTLGDVAAEMPDPRQAGEILRQLSQTTQDFH